jgi:NitT/TauT family transport system substrate-binding protein
MFRNHLLVSELALAGQSSVQPTTQEGSMPLPSFFRSFRANRRQFAGLVMGAALSVAVPALAQAITLRVGHFPNITHAQALVARALAREGHDWFAPRLGPDVKIEWYSYNAGPSAMEAMFANSIDLTYVGPSPALNAFYRSRGQEVRVVAGAVKGGSALVVQGDGGLTKPQDFKSKRIATPQFGNTQDVTARAWLSAGGLRITQTGGDAQVVPTQNPDQLALFRSKQLDAVWTVEQWISRHEMEAGGKVLVNETDAVTTILVSSRKFLGEHADLVKRFVAAHGELTQWIAAHPEEAQSLLRRELNAEIRTTMPADLVAHAWGRMKVTTELGAGEFDSWVKDAKKAGFLRGSADLSQFLVKP